MLRSDIRELIDVLERVTLVSSRVVVDNTQLLQETKELSCTVELSDAMPRRLVSKYRDVVVRLGKQLLEIEQRTDTVRVALAKLIVFLDKDFVPQSPAKELKRGRVSRHDDRNARSAKSRKNAVR